MLSVMYCDTMALKTFPFQFDPRLAINSQLMYSPCPWTPSYHCPPTLSVPSTTCHAALLPNTLTRHPQTWTKEDVRVWLNWCAQEYAIEPVSPDKFDMNGKALCLLNRKDMMDRDPQSGDILFNALQQIITKSEVPLPFPFTPYPLRLPAGTNFPVPPVSPSPDFSQSGLLVLSGNTTQTTFSTPRSTPSFIPILPQPSHQHQPSPCQAQQEPISAVVTSVPEGVLSPAPTSTDTDSAPSDGDSNIDEMDLQESDVRRVDLESNSNYYDEAFRLKCVATLKKAEPDCRLLWEFIHQLLTDAKYKHLVCWENVSDLVFRIVNPTGLAELWGHQKNRTNMTYEKLSRALRYYYKMNIIRKVPGKRLTYKFLQHPSTIRKGQRGARPHAKTNLMLQNGINEPKSEPSLDVGLPRLAISDQQSHDHIPSPSHMPSQSRRLSPATLTLPDRHSEMMPPPTLFRYNETHSNIHFVKGEIPIQDEPEDLSFKRESRNVIDNVDRSQGHMCQTNFQQEDGGMSEDNSSREREIGIKIEVTA
ncbi:transcription factor ETV6 isoform X2 [Patella vulgata]|uniref:transcription factor ETV6 isoform X2 n=1 Tax=Patella vulgata TaxID=6465 RepID=UPI0024A9EBB7|nr:transcription factor ETV6 isoform X2 [Patella vulgata]